MDKFLRCSKLLFVVFLINVNTTFAQFNWEVLGSENQIANATSNYTSIVALTENGEVIPYVAFTESGVAKVKKYQSGVWQQVGGNVSSGSAGFLNLKADKNNKLYITYVDLSASNKLAVKYFNSSNSTWKPVANDLYASSGTILNGQSEERIPYNNAIAFDSNQVPYVAFGEFSDGGHAWVKKLEDGEWKTLGSGAINSTDRANSIDIAFTSTDIPYIVFHEGTTSGLIKAYRFTNNSWEDLLVPTTFSSGVRTTRIAIDKLKNSVVINYSNAASGTTANAILFDGNTWQALGGRIGSGSAATYTSSLAAKGNFYCLFRDQMSNNNGTYRSRIFECSPISNVWKEVGLGGGFDGPISSYTSMYLGSDNNMYFAYIKTNANNINTPVVQVIKQEAKGPADVPNHAPKQMEYLDRGLVAVKVNTNQTFLSWRLLGTDPSDISFNIYKGGLKLNSSPLANATNYLDLTTASGNYYVRPVINGIEQNPSANALVTEQNYLNVPLQRPAGGTTPDGVAYTYTPNDCSVGDLDGDGVYEIVVKWDPTNSSDNSGAAYSGNTLYDAYKLDGTRLWRIDLGINIHSGAHYTPFTVYDLDGDGKAEFACRTSDGTIDGGGTMIGSAIDYRDSQGRVLTGASEFVTIFNGETGKAMASADYYPARGDVNDWGDNYGNRSDRFVDAVAYLDGERPSLITGRGYYTRLVRVAWDWRDGKLTRRWIFDSSTLGNSAYNGQGNHQMSVADVDGDGKQEIFNGSSAINDNGEGLWTDGKGHGDAMHLTDLDPDRPGLEMWNCLEEEGNYRGKGLVFRDAKTGETLFGVNTTGDIGRCMVADIDPRHKGYEVWGPRGGLFDAKGTEFSSARPTTMNFGVWWDGDLLREFLDDVTISKWDYQSSTTKPLLAPTGVLSNNSTKATPNLSADIFGDWREEVIWRAEDNASLRIYTTTAPTDYRIPTLMHDPQYRVAISWQNSGYNQPPYPSFYIGPDMATPEFNIKMVTPTTPPVKPVISPAGQQTTCIGQGFELSSSATVGNQWYKDGVAIEGAIMSTYVPIENGEYTVIASNICCSSVSSDPVSVTVQDAPVSEITAQGPTTFIEGGNVTLESNAISGATYQWYKDGVALTDQQAQTYVATQTGAYTVEITSAGCTAFSEPTTVTVIFSLSPENFKVSTTAATCKSAKNGKINVVAQATNYIYSATLKQVGSTSTNEYNFSVNNLEITGLLAGSYELCIKIKDRPTYSQCFDLVVSEPESLSAYATLSADNQTVTVNLAGAEKYYVELNGKMHITSENQLLLDLVKNKTNVLRVTSDKPCQGEINEILSVDNNTEIYPNPFDDVLNIALAPNTKDVSVTVLSVAGTKVFQKNYINYQGILQLPLSHLAPGIYTLKLKCEDTVKSFKIIKK